MFEISAETEETNVDVLIDEICHASRELSEAALKGFQYPASRV